MHAFDRQTDEQMDRILIARPHLHFMQHGKHSNAAVSHLINGTKRLYLQLVTVNTSDLLQGILPKSVYRASSVSSMNG